MTLIEVSNLKKSFGDNEVLKQISFSIEKNEVVAINYLGLLIDKGENGTSEEKEKVEPYLNEAQKRLKQLQPPEVTVTTQIPPNMKSRAAHSMHGGENRLGAERGSFPGHNDYPQPPIPPPSPFQPQYGNESFAPPSNPTSK